MSRLAEASLTLPARESGIEKVDLVQAVGLVVRGGGSEAGSYLRLIDFCITQI